MSIIHRIDASAFPARSKPVAAASHGAMLGSWKEVAAALGVTARTAQRWERQRGLPIRRYPGPRGRIQVDPRELQAWQAGALRSQHDLPSPVRSRRPMLLAHFRILPVVTLQAPLLRAVMRRLAAYARGLATRQIR